MVCTSLFDIYAKCGVLCRVRKALEPLHFWDVVSLIETNCYGLCPTEAQQGSSSRKLFSTYAKREYFSKTITYICILKVCCMTQDVDMGKKINDYIVLALPLVYMFAECVVDKAQIVLEELSMQNVISWSLEWEGQEVLGCFQQMQREGTTPDAITNTRILKVEAHMYAECGVL